jgi:peroxisomal membrane protein 2
VLGSNLAGVPPKRPARHASALTQILASSHIDSKAVKMALYGFFVSAPLGHYLVGALQKAFLGKTSTRARIGQILASNLLIAPIQTAGQLLLLRSSAITYPSSISLLSFYGGNSWC